MATRTSRTEVAFRRPFILDGMDAVQPAGVYAVDTEEESLDTLLSLGWRRVRTVMIIAKAGLTEYLSVRPEQLHEALMRDGAQHDPVLSLSSDAPKARRDRVRAMRHTPRNRT